MVDDAFNASWLDALIKDVYKQPELKALPVSYKGYRMRSRCEGRWAVFFDSIGIDFQYEQQGFEIGGKVCYLPDFWLPVVNCFAEVKPFDPTADEKAKCEAIVRGTGHTFLYLSGPPDFREYTGISLDAGDITEATYTLDIHAHMKAYRDEHRFWSNDAHGTNEKCCTQCFLEAIYASRAARFDGSDLG